MLVLDLFAGTGSSTQAFEDAGHRVIKVELDRQHVADYHYDIGLLTPDDLRQMCNGVPDLVWASPPCTAFSVASLGHHWTGGHRAYEPRTKFARESMALVAHVRHLVESSGAPFWVIENPRGVLRKLPILDGITRHTITYCQYGDDRMKPTDLWVSPELAKVWTPRPMCKNGDACHEAAPRGSKTGTQGRAKTKDRSRVPLELSQELLAAIIGLDRIYAPAVFFTL